MLLYSPYSLHHSIFKWNEWNVSPRLFLISSLLVLCTTCSLYEKARNWNPNGLIVVYIAHDQNKTENSILTVGITKARLGKSDDCEQWAECFDPSALFESWIASSNFKSKYCLFLSLPTQLGMLQFLNSWGGQLLYKAVQA